MTLPTPSLPTDLGTPRLAELLHGELRGSVTIPCPPGDTRNGTKRFWCKAGSTGCALIADTNGYVAKSYEGRIFITPQDSSGAFKVLINDLRKEDAGLYRCGTGSLGSRDSPRDVALQVTTGRMGRWVAAVPWGLLVASEKEHEILINSH